MVNKYLKPHLTPEERTKQKLEGKTLAFIYAAVVLLALASIFWLGRNTDVREVPFFGRFILYFPAIIVLLMVSPLWVRGAKLLQPTANEILETDTRPPILYLRSFGNDVDDFLATVNTQIELLFPVAGLSIEEGSKEGSFTNEVYFTGKLSNVGPVIAIGKPGDKLPTLGAARFYVNDDDWKEAVLHTAKSCSIIAFSVDEDMTDGLKWEMSSIIQKEEIHKIVFFIPKKKEMNKETREYEIKETGECEFVNDAAYFVLKNFLKNQFQITIPRHHEGADIVLFDADGQPTLTRLETHTFSPKDYLKDAALQQVSNFTELPENKWRKWWNTFSHGVISVCILLLLTIVIFWPEKIPVLEPEESQEVSGKILSNIGSEIFSVPLGANQRQISRVYPSVDWFSFGTDKRYGKIESKKENPLQTEACDITFDLHEDELEKVLIYCNLSSAAPFTEMRDSLILKFGDPVLTPTDERKSYLWATNNLIILLSLNEEPKLKYSVQIADREKYFNRNKSK